MTKGGRSDANGRGASTGPDEVAALPFGSMVRFGRFIEFQGPSSVAEYEGMREAFLAEADRTGQGMDELHARLVEILSETDPIDLVARASLTYLHHNPDTYKEWQDDRSPAHVEFLALQALGVGSGEVNHVDPVRACELTFEAVEIVRDMFRSASMRYVAAAIAARRAQPLDPNIDHRLRAQLESLGVRGTGYGEHVERVLHGCFDPFETDCRDI
ncbi:MAG: hypothetical protein ABI595_12150, partial [Actinomycetota bacterium]